jgi:hypothetical protein
LFCSFLDDEVNGGGVRNPAGEVLNKYQKDDEIEPE